MFLCMRTTIHIDDHLFTELKRIAADKGETLSAVIQDALCESLSRRHATEQLPIDLPLFHGTGVRPGVGLINSVSLLNLIE